MNHFCKILFFASFLLLANLRSYAQFLGSNGDGHSNLRLVNSVCPVVNVNPFLGSDGDGHSNLRLVNIVCPIVNVNPFLGSDGDGHSNLRLTNIVCPIVNVNPFLGSDGDGHSNLRLTNIVCPIVNVNPFLGSDGDGHSNLRLANIVCTIVNVNPFLGSDGDGGADIQLTNVTRSTCQALPIELISFDAKCNANKTVRLAWTTASETNSYFFTVERTSDAIHFETIGKIDGAGNSNQLKKYSFTDTTSTLGYLYYRLKQTDYNGDYQYSNIVATDCNEKSSTIIIYPNPNTGEFVINGFGKEGFLVVYNVLGEIIEAKKIENDRVKVNLKDQHNGFYFIIIESENKKITNEKIIVNR
jgi:hypothetical protein